MYFPSPRLDIHDHILFYNSMKHGNLYKEGGAFGKIIGGKYNGHTTSVSGKDEQGVTYLGIAKDAKLQLIPNEKIEREIPYTTGPSGNGKSTFVKTYLKKYGKAFKGNPV